MRALTVGLCLTWLCCSEQIELFPHGISRDAGGSDLAYCAETYDVAGTPHPCGCLALCETDADCPRTRCDPAVALCTGTFGSCTTAAECSVANTAVRGWLCRAAPSQ